MTDTRIQPCPFCGHTDPAIDEVDSGVWALCCEGCGCTGPIETFENAKQTPERATELWNRRAVTLGVADG